MANAFTPIRGWRWGGGAAKAILAQEGTLVIDTTALGGATPDDMPASMFGLKKIIGPCAIVNSAETKVFTGVPDYTGDSLMITDGSAAGAVADLPNDTYKLFIQGYS